MMEKKTITEEDTIFPMASWKLYDNPLFNYTFPINHPYHNHNHSNRFSPTRFHHLNHNMEARVRELKEELDLERRLRKKVESLNKASVKELTEERQRRESLERELEGLSGETCRAKAEMERLRVEVVEERRMVKISEVLREERVHMKMSEAKLVKEEKLLKLSSSPSTPQLQDTQITKADADRENNSEMMNKPEKEKSTGELRSGDSDNVRGFGLKENNKQQRQQQRKEVENPHIKRGIIGYVEFPTKLVRSRAGNLVGSFLGGTTATREGMRNVCGVPKLEVQKGQLRVLLKHNNGNNNKNRVIPLGTSRFPLD